MTKHYDPVIGEPESAEQPVEILKGDVLEDEDEDDDEEDDDDGFNEEGFDTEDIESYEDQRDGLRYMLGPDHSTGRLWHEINSTLQSLTVAMQASDRGCLVRTISWIRSHNDGEDVQWIFHDTSTWLPVTLEDLKAEPT